MKDMTAEEAFHQWMDRLRDRRCIINRRWLESPTHTARRSLLGHLCAVLDVERTAIEDVLNDRWVIQYGQGRRKSSTELPDEVARLMNMTPRGLFRDRLLPGDGRAFESVQHLGAKAGYYPDRFAVLLEHAWESGNFVRYGE